MLKQKRVLWITFAVVFLIVLFFVKTGFLFSLFNNEETFRNPNQENSLVYGSETVIDLVNKDTDGDGVLDWQENLYGLDPNKKETTAGTPDSVAISKLKTGQEASVATNKNATLVEENLTETDKFSRELFAMVAASNQSGTLDQATIDALGASLSERIQNSQPRKVFSIFDIKTINDESAQAFKNYNTALSNLFKKYPSPNYTILDVLQKFVIDENTVDVSILAKLDPIIVQINKIMEGIKKISVPQSISTLHLNVINAEERLVENLIDIKLYDTDPILSLGGISKYQENATSLESALNSLADIIIQKLRN